MKLLTDAQLGSIQKIAKLGMQTDVSFSRRTTSTGLELTDDPYGSSVEHEDIVTVTPVRGMFHSTPTPVAVVDGGALVTVNTYRLWVPINTDVLPGDTADINGNIYVVADTTADETWPAFLACSLRLRE